MKTRPQLWRLVRLLAMAAMIAAPATALAQTGRNVLLVVNDLSDSGDLIARRYAERRTVPTANICHIRTAITESLPREQYAASIEEPVWHCIARASGQDRILYIVLTKGVPLRIDGTAGREGTVASVDSELSLLYRRRTGEGARLAGFVPNPYFAGATPIEEWRPFTHDRLDIYLVTRLDGFTVDDALALIERGQGGVQSGQIVLDQRASWTATGNVWLKAAADRLQAIGSGDRVVFDDTGKVVTGERGVLGYYSWGSNDPAIRIRDFRMEFAPGALAGMFVSSDGRTLREPPAAWLPAEAGDPTKQWAGSAQSLTGDLIRAGVTGVAGHVFEPFLDATVRPEILFPAYLRGLNLAEAFYLAMPYLSWQTVVFGDPLCAPFRIASLTDGDIDRGLDSTTELPAAFSERRLLAFSKSVAAPAVVAALRAQARADRGDRQGVLMALEEAVGADPRFTAARLLLASQYEATKNYDSAIAQYRRVLEYAPNDAVALNNLAYALAVHKHVPEEALALAQRAAIVAPGDANVLDTVAWVYHLTGNRAEAVRNITAAVARASARADLRLHAAAILLASGDRARARAELESAFRLDPEMRGNPEAQDLSNRLELPPP